MGKLDQKERITRILKLALESQYKQPFVTRAGAEGSTGGGLAICRANRTAKPISGHASFGCSKFFIMADTDERLFKCGLQEA